MINRLLEQKLSELQAHKQHNAAAASLHLEEISMHLEGNEDASGRTWVNRFSTRVDHAWTNRSQFREFCVEQRVSSDTGSANVIVGSCLRYMLELI